MQRREALAILVGATVALPLAGRAQQKPMPVIGLLSPGSSPPSSNTPSFAPFRQGLSETGYIEGQNVAIEYRYAENNNDPLPALAADLVGRKVDLIVTIAAAPAVAAKNATSTIPIVFMGVSDPVGLGLVASLVRPGGNVTGYSNTASQLTPKRLELLTELVPQAKVIALLINPTNPITHNDLLIRNLEEAARAKGVRLATVKAATEGEINSAFATLIELQAGGLVVASDPFMLSRRDQLAALASRHAIPTIYHLRSFVEAGGLISYGIDNIAIWNQGGSYAGKILKGAKPADLPVQQPTKFELVINLKTAQALGLTVPPSLLAGAEVIE